MRRWRVNSKTQVIWQVDWFKRCHAARCAGEENRMHRVSEHPNHKHRATETNPQYLPATRAETLHAIVWARGHLAGCRNVLPQLCNLRPPVLYPEHIADHPCYYEWKRTHSKARLDRDREFRTRCAPNHTRLRKRMTEKIKVSTHTQCIHKSKISSSQMWGPHEIPSRCTDTVDR